MAVNINDTPNRVRYTATAGQTAFSVPFQFLAATDLKIYQNGVLKTIFTHYTVTGAGASSGTVTLVSGAAVSDDILIIRDMPVQRIGDFPISGPFDVESLNTQLDGLTMMVRDLETRSDRRSLKLSVADLPETMSSIPAKAQRSGNLLSFDADGNPIASIPSQPISDISAAVAAAQASASAADADADRAEAAADRIDLGTFDADVAATATAKTLAESARDAAVSARTGAETAQTGAIAARTGAETARDAALVNSTMYATEAAGRAAVADGAYFKVIGSGTVACREYVRVNVSTSTLVAEYPSLAAYDGLTKYSFYGIDCLPPGKAGSAIANNNAVAWVNDGGYVSIKCANAGNIGTSYIVFVNSLTPAEIGSGEMLFEAYFEHTSGITLATLFPTLNFIRTISGGTTVTTSGSFISLDATHTKVSAIVSTLANDQSLFAFIQAASAVMAADIEVKLLGSRTINLTNGADIDASIRREKIETTQRQALVRLAEDQAPQIIAAVPTYSAYVANGAVAGSNSFTVPQNSTGQTSFIFVTLENASTAVRLARVVGKSIRMRAIIECTNRYRVPDSFNVFRITAGGSNTDINGSINWLSNTIAEVTATYTVTADTTQIAYLFQFTGSRTQIEGAFTFYVREVSYKINGAENGMYWTDQLRTEASNKYGRAVPVVPNYSTIISPGVAEFNGAITTYDALTGRVNGYRIPIGQTGQTTYFELPLPMADPDFAKFNGKRVRMTITAEVENYIARSYITGINYFGSATGTLHEITTNYDNLRKMFTATAELTVSWTPGVAANGTRPYVMNGAASAAAAEMLFKFVGFYWEPVSSTFETAADQEFAEPFPVLSVRRQIDYERTRRQFKPGLGYKIITVNSDTGSGAMFTGRTGLQDAIASITDATADNQYELHCTGTFWANEVAHYTLAQFGIYTFIVPKDYVHMVGQGMCNLIGTLPDGTANMNGYDVLHFDAIARMENFFIYGRNINYATHFEGAGFTPNIERYLRNVHCKFDGPTNKVALGYGSSSGERLLAEDCTFESSGPTAVYIHNNASFKQENTWHLKRCRLLSGGQSTPGNILSLHSIGSGHRDLLRLEDCTVDAGSIVFNDVGWRNTTVLTADADHTEVKLVAPDFDPRAISYYYYDTCLLFKSKTTGLTSSVTFDQTSTAFNAVIGNSLLSIAFQNEFYNIQQYGYDRKVGGVGVAGFAISRNDIADNNRGGATPYAKMLGKRLGDCSAVNKTLTVVVDGTSYNVVFNKNYDGTAANVLPSYSNAAILAEIQTVVGSVCDVSLYAYGINHYPVFKGNMVVSNSDTTAILSGMGVVFTGQGLVRIATNADGKIDGIALDDFAAGTRGRIITRGEMNCANSAQRFSLREVNTTARTFGTEMGISSSSPGVFDPAATPKLVRAVRDNVAAFK